MSPPVIPVGRLPARLDVQCHSEEEARALQAAVDAFLDFPNWDGVRVGRGRHAASDPHRPVTVTSANPHPSEDGRTWYYPAYERGVHAALAFQLISNRRFPTPSDGIVPEPAEDDRERVLSSWYWVAGCFREFLEKLDTNLAVDCVAVQVDRASGAVQWRDLQDEGSAGVFHGLNEILETQERDGLHVIPTPIWYSDPEVEAGVFLQFDAQQWREYPRICAPGMKRLFESFPEAYLACLFTDISWEREMAYSAVRLERLRCRAAQACLTASTASLRGEPISLRLFDTLNELSRLGYERRPPRGRIAFSDGSGDAPPWLARLREPVRLSATKRVRKLLEASGAGALASNSVSVQGAVETHATTHPCVVFEGLGSWRFDCPVPVFWSDWGTPGIRSAGLDALRANVAETPTAS